MTVIMCAVLWLNSIFVSQVWGERNNYHLSDIKIHAEHFHGQSLHSTCLAKKKDTLSFDYKKIIHNIEI